MSKPANTTKGWGIVNDQGSEIWDALPIFVSPNVTIADRITLLFYPKRFVLFREIHKQLKKQQRIRILDVGCGTGAAMIDMKRLWGDRVEVSGVEVVRIQVDMANQRFVQEQVDAQVVHYDGVHIPVESGYFDVVYTSDVLGHVQDVESWLEELARVSKPGGLLAMFSESKLGKHAWIRNYLLKRGVNTDPHAEFHISLLSKDEIRQRIEQVGFTIEKMYSTVWAKFFVHPDELYPALQQQKRFFMLRKINAALYWLKKKTHPFSTALAELYSLIEMITIGRWVQSQGYVIVAKKK